MPCDFSQILSHERRVESVLQQLVGVARAQQQDRGEHPDLRVPEVVPWNTCQQDNSIIDQVIIV